MSFDELDRPRSDATMDGSGGEALGNANDPTYSTLTLRMIRTRITSEPSTTNMSRMISEIHYRLSLDYVASFHVHIGVGQIHSTCSLLLNYVASTVGW